jgi:hypothetical protein
MNRHEVACWRSEKCKRIHDAKTLIKNFNLKKKLQNFFLTKVVTLQTFKENSHARINQIKNIKKDTNELNNKRDKYNYLIDEGTKEVGMIEFSKHDAQKCHEETRKKKHNAHDTKVGMIEK